VEGKVNLYDLFTPNKALSPNAVRLLVLVQVAVFLLIWSFSPTVFLPKPGEVLHSFVYLWTQEGLGAELITSFLLNLEALFWATIVTLVLSYAAIMPFFRPMVTFVGKMRFLSLAGLSFFFTLMASNGHELKVYLLVFSITVFYVTSMADVIDAAPRELFDLARTLNMGEWRTSIEVIVLGQAHESLVAMRANAAMGWMFLSLVEGISREGGGIGALLLDQNKHFHLSAVFAIQICILLVGLGQDYTIGLLDRTICPYASLVTERK
jgi:NitT/TauT family transport system permease protein